MAEPLIDRPDLRVLRSEPDAQLLLHCEPDRAGELSELSGVALGEGMLRCQRSGAWHALHLAPDEWLLVGPIAESAQMAARFENSPAIPLSLVDVSERSLGVEVSGDAAATLLNSGCPLDLHPAMFPADACTRTLFGKVSVMLWRLPGSDGFRMQYGRSFDPYVTDFLTTASADVAEPAAKQGTPV